MKNINKLPLSIASTLLLLIYANGYSANRYWIAKATEPMWNNPANWSATSGGPGGASVPGASDFAIFDAKGPKQCMINAPVNVSKLFITNTYKDTIKQNDFPITVGAGGLLVHGGVFLGGSVDITVATRFTLNGGTFISTTATLIVQGANADFISGNFLHNKGKVKFYYSKTIKGKATFYDLEISSVIKAISALTITDTITSNHLLQISGAYPVNINLGPIVCKGDVQLANTNASSGGSANFIFKGGSNQTLTGLSVTSQGALGNITIDKSGGELLLENIIIVKSNWIYLQGIVSPGTSTVIFTAIGRASCQGVNNTMAFYNARFNKTTVLTGNLSILGKLIISQGATLDGNSRSLFIGGDWENSGIFIKGSSGVIFNGASSQYIKKTSGIQDFFNIAINKSAGKLYLNTPVVVYKNLSLQKGILVTTSVNSIKLLDNATAEGASHLSYIAGSITKTGNDAFTFHLGDTILTEGAYHPLTITAPATVTDEFTAAYFASNQPYGIAIQSDSLGSVSNCEYWVLTRKAGTSTVIPSVGWNLNSCNMQEDIASLRLAAWDGNQWVALGGTSVSSDPKTGTLSARSGMNLPVLPITIGFPFQRRRASSEAVLKNKLDAGYYTLFNGYLKFKYDEEYVNNNNELEFNIYDKNRIVVISQSSPGVGLNIMYKDNRCGLDVQAINPALTPGFYVLEVKDKKGEIGLLRFKL